MKTRLCLFVLVVVSASGSFLAQSPPQGQSQPTFRVGTNYIRVDMHATLDGRPVTDLRVDEIEVLEDGIPQTIEAFEHVLLPGSSDPGTRVEPTTVADSRAMARDARARVFVIFLDTYHTQEDGVTTMRMPLVRFLDRLLGPDDLVALMTPEMRVTELTFSRKTDVIASVVQDEWWGRRARGPADEDPKEQLYRACYSSRREGQDLAVEMRDRRREKLTLDTLENLAVYLGGVREERKAVLTITEGWRLYTEDQLLARTFGDQPVPAAGPEALRGGQTSVRESGPADWRECEADRLSLALMNSPRRLRDVEEAANRANVSFYPVYARGLVAFDTPLFPDRPPTPIQDRANLAAREDSLRELAENTDGTAVVRTNMIESSITRIAEDLASYYLFAYYSTNTKLDGRFREITVRVKRPGVQVRARRGYRGLTPEEVAMATNTRTSAPTSVSAAPPAVTLNPRAPFRVRTSAWTIRDAVDAPRAEVWLVGELDASVRRELAWSAGATADIVVVAANGMEVAAAVVEVPASDGAFALRLPAGTGIEPGEYAVRVRVRPTADAALPVTDTVRLIVPQPGSVLGEPVIWRRGPSTGPRHLVTADPRFRRNERIRLELPTAASGTPTARMLDRLGNAMQVPVQVSERVDPSGSFRWIVIDATLAPLALGEYGIGVTLGNSRQVGSFQIVR